MRFRFPGVVVALSLCTYACSDSTDTPASSPADAGSSDATPSSPDGGAPDAGSADTGVTTPSDGTVHVTYNLDNAGEKSFDCVAEKRTFLHHTVASGGSITLGCTDGSPGLDVIYVGVGTPDKVGTFDESQLSAVTFQKGTLELNSGAAAKAASPPQHTVTVTTWDKATEHAVGEANLPAFKDKGNSTSDHTLTMKITFDVTTKEAQ